MSSFSTALGWLNEGYEVRRAGWNGKGMHLEYAGKSVFDRYIDELGVVNGVPVSFKIEQVPMEPFIVMYTADKKWVPWLASQTDLLADDWELVE